MKKDKEMKLKEMKLARSIEMENEAIDGIISFFNSNDASSMTPRSIMSLILMQIRDACVTTQSANATAEHNMLIQTQEYLNGLIDLFDSNGPLTIPITGIEFDDCIKNLERIKNKAPNSLVKERLDFFITRLNDTVEQYAHANASSLKKSIPLGIITGFLFSFILGLGVMPHDSVGEIFSNFAFWFVGIMMSAFASAFYWKYLHL